MPPVGLVLRSLGEIEATFTAAHAAVLARFDAVGAHDGDGYGTSAAWLMAMAAMTRPDAKATAWRMRLLRGHPEMAGALADADISKSQALAIAKWTKKLPAELRAETVKILVQAATAGASLDDLRMIAAVALERWRASRPDGDEDGFDDRYVQAGTSCELRQQAGLATADRGGVAWHQRAEVGKRETITMRDQQSPMPSPRACTSPARNRVHSHSPPTARAA